MAFSGAADTPVFSVPDGTYTSVQTVAITDATQGTTIYFTTDGTPPTTGSSVYNQPITVSEAETGGYRDSHGVYTKRRCHGGLHHRSAGHSQLNDNAIYIQHHNGAGVDTNGCC